MRRALTTGCCCEHEYVRQDSVAVLEEAMSIDQVLVPDAAFFWPASPREALKFPSWRTASPRGETNGATALADAGARQDVWMVIEEGNFLVGQSPTSLAPADAQQKLDLAAMPSVTGLSTADTAPQTGGLRLLASKIQRTLSGSPPVADRGTPKMAPFSGEEYPLRGARLADVVGCWGRALQSSGGSTKANARLQAVTRIDTFISYDWMVPRSKKFLSLALHFNLGFALLVSTLAMAAAAYWTVKGYLPIMRGGFSSYPRGLACKAVGPPVFLVVLLFCRDLERCVLCCRRRPRVFIDGTSVHQEEDVAGQPRSAEMLGSVLWRSSGLLAIHSDAYLRRLSNAYELAGFLAMKGARRIQVIPALVPQAVAWGVAFAFVSTNVGLMAETVRRSHFLELVLVITCPCLVMTLRTLGRELARAKEQAAAFNVCECECAVEADREAIYRNIVALMKGMNFVEEASSQDKALLAFNELVQSRVPKLLDDSWGSGGGLRYRHIVAMVAALALPSLGDDMAGWLRMSSYPLPGLLVLIARWGVLGLCACPLCVATWAYLVTFRTHWTGVREKVFVFLISGLGVGVVSGISRVMDGLPVRTRDKFTWAQVSLPEHVLKGQLRGIVMLAVLHGVLVLLTAAVFWRPDLWAALCARLGRWLDPIFGPWLQAAGLLLDGPSARLAGAMAAASADDPEAD